MFRHIRVIASDFFGLCRVCGPRVATRWLFAIAKNFRACQASKNLQPADAAVGDGPFRVRLRQSRAVLCGTRVLTGIREIWVRDPYLANFLAFSPSARVVDLGANMGVFTALALGHGPGVRVVAVEADPAECSRLQRTLAGNDGHSRTLVLNAFVGGETDFQIGLKSADRCAAVPTLTQQELLSQIGPGPLDLIKCDIEGSEFALLADSAPLFASARQIAMELHPHAGNPDVIIDRLRQMGFEIRLESRPPTILLRARRGAIPSPTTATAGP